MDFVTGRYFRRARTTWYEHICETPAGMVPVLINGCIPAYQSAMGTDFAGAKLLKWFWRIPFEYWPRWVGSTFERHFAPHNRSCFPHGPVDVGAE